MDDASFLAMDAIFMDMATEIRELNTEKGWREKQNTFAEYIALLHSEVSEMLEEWRNRNPQELAMEYADVLIRLVDMADVFGVSIPLAYRAKMEKNWNRPYQHGGKTI